MNFPARAVAMASFAGLFGVGADTAAATATASLSTAPSPNAVATDWPARRKQTLYIVWSTVHQAHFDPAFGGVDWVEVGKRYNAKLADVADNASLRRMLNAMLAELDKSHFAILPREVAVFSPAERARMGTVGIEVEAIAGHIVVVQVKAGSAAARANLRLGMMVRAVDGVEIASVAAEMKAMNLDDDRTDYFLSNFVSARARGAVGTTMRVEGTNPDGTAVAVALANESHDGAWSEPVGGFPAMPLECETQRDETGIGYVRFNVFAPAIVKQVRTFLRNLEPGDGLIIDLRGNPGGVMIGAEAITGWLVDRELSLGSMRMRQGSAELSVYPQERAFLGPVSVLVDGGSASTSEILAAGLRDHGRARVFGARTAGAALPSVFHPLPTGDLFQYAIAELRTPKQEAIEGRGVQPDESVQRTIADIVNGRDATKEAARAWLDQARRGPSAKKS